MSNKTEEYLALAQRTANGLTRYWESWTDYLTTASRLYKYPFADQLMIYAQRPDATACADYDVWNNRMNRYVRRGSKGIALLDESSGYPRTDYCRLRAAYIYSFPQLCDYGVSLPSVCCFKTFFDFFSKTSWQGFISMVDFL